MGTRGHPPMKPNALKTSTLPTGTSVKTRLALMAGVLALLAIPHLAHAQGIVGGAQEGAREGGRAAGPVGAVVGGAVGAGVGGAVGAGNGRLGIPHTQFLHGYLRPGHL